MNELLECGGNNDAPMSKDTVTNHAPKERRKGDKGKAQNNLGRCYLC